MPPEQLMFCICSVTEEESSGRKIGIQSHDFRDSADSGFESVGYVRRSVTWQPKRKFERTTSTPRVWQGVRLKPNHSPVYDLATTLKQVKEPMIKVECRTCGRSDALERKVLVRKHGAGMTFARLRRMAAMGCDRLISADGDQCHTCFPCLQSPVLSPDHD